MSAHGCGSGTIGVDRQLLPGSPAGGVKGPRVRREPRGRAITQAHIRALLAAAQDPQTEAIVYLLSLNGLRVSEVCRADIEDLRREPGGNHSLVIRAKGGKELEVALNERTERAVLRTVRARSQGAIFRRQDGRRVRPGNSLSRRLSLSASATDTPSRANRSAIALPIPWPAPVTSPTLPTTSTTQL